MISIMVGVNSFHIGFNNHHYCDFQFRLPKTDARFITVIMKRDQKKILRFHNLIQFKSVQF